MRILLPVLILAVTSLPGQPLAPRLRPILKANETTHWGVHAVQLRTGRVLASYNANQFFIPASNTKLFSTAFALTALGVDYKFQTRVLAASPITNASITGDLVLHGSGDPSLSARIYPYDKDNSFATDHLQPLRDLARRLYSQGLRHVTGSIIGDDSAQPHDPIPNGWSADDGLFEYGAPVSALTFNDNVFSITVHPTDGITLNPPTEYFAFLNQTTSDATRPRRIRITREPGVRTATITGNLPPDAAPYTNDLSVDEPALFAAIAFRQVLREEGIRVDGPAVARHEAPAQPESVELASRESAPLLQLLQTVNKVSQNLHAELVLRAAEKKMPFEAFLKLAQIDPKQVSLQDGSGMSRLNLVTPTATVQLLSFLNKQGQLEAFRDLLAIGGQDGTLRNRFDKNPKATAIRAKTGSLSHVSALGGYAESKRYGTIAFQIVANNYNAPAQEVRSAIDRIALALLQ